MCLTRNLIENFQKIELYMKILFKSGRIYKRNLISELVVLKVSMKRMGKLR